MEQLENLDEERLELAIQPLAAEPVDCPEVWGPHTAQPHEGDIFNEEPGHLSAGVDITEICVTITFSIMLGL